MQNNISDLTQAMKITEVMRLRNDGPPIHESREVVVEDVLTLEIKDVGSFSLMCTPIETIPLAVGFAFTEGVITNVDQILVLAKCLDEPGVIRMQVDDPTRAQKAERTLIVSSSCGLCGGKKAVDEVLSGLPSVADTLRVPARLLHDLLDKLNTGQDIYSRTRGTHAAGLFSSNGDLLAMAEDLGRHNALDKTIGKCLLQKRPTAGSIVVLSSRVSMELVSKASRAGAQMIVAISAPSSLAVEFCERCNITLCASVRGEQATVYTHPQRISVDPM